MKGRISTALLIVMLAAVQPALAQENVITLDLGHTTDEELAEAMDVSAELELIMLTEWDWYEYASSSETGER